MYRITLIVNCKTFYVKDFTWLDEFPLDIIELIQANTLGWQNKNPKTKLNPTDHLPLQSPSPSPPIRRRSTRPHLLSIHHRFPPSLLLLHLDRLRRFFPPRHHSLPFPNPASVPSFPPLLVIASGSSATTPKVTQLLMIYISSASLPRNQPSSFSHDPRQKITFMEFVKT
ncbi:hypothetical protein RIF29_12659 [Crotalaria pallida]|uniref:Uncharacterized protein n=1 Tax=Crotalaria pallida TaxID=3830 RepID=A0AAN9ING6_CROPI